jgi:hypothetical protein
MNQNSRSEKGIYEVKHAEFKKYELTKVQF